MAGISIICVISGQIHPVVFPNNSNSFPVISMKLQILLLKPTDHRREVAPSVGQSQEAVDIRPEAVPAGAPDHSPSRATGKRKRVKIRIDGLAG